MKGYKVFNHDWTCRGFQYKVGETYTHDGDVEVCESGFHFCERAVDCFNYYDFDPRNKVAEVEAYGEVKKYRKKSATNCLKVVREIPWGELLGMVNTGDRNSGCLNSGHYNSGDRNSGCRNSGDWNSGDSNSGSCNSGYCNSGYYNSGDWNSGDWNSGDCNSGDWNLSNGNSGCFCTEESTIKLFDKESEMTWRDWKASYACELLSSVRHVEWVSSRHMTEEEKERNPSHETTGGYLRERSLHDACRAWWNALDEAEKDVIKDIPNFDAEKFKLITGVDVSG